MRESVYCESTGWGPLWPLLSYLGSEKQPGFQGLYREWARVPLHDRRTHQGYAALKRSASPQFHLPNFSTPPHLLPQAFLCIVRKEEDPVAPPFLFL